MNCWNKWCRKLPSKIDVQRSLVPHREEVQATDLHAFGDASGQGTCAAVYAVIHQNEGTAQGLVKPNHITDSEERSNNPEIRVGVRSDGNEADR